MNSGAQDTNGRRPTRKIPTLTTRTFRLIIPTRPTDQTPYQSLSTRFAAMGRRVQKIPIFATTTSSHPTAQRSQLASHAVGLTRQRTISQALIVAQVQFRTSAGRTDQSAILVEETCGAVLDGVGAKKAAVDGLVVGRQTGVTREYPRVVDCTAFAVWDLAGDAWSLNSVEDQPCLALGALQGVCNYWAGRATWDGGAILASIVEEAVVGGADAALKLGGEVECAELAVGDGLGAGDARVGGGKVEAVEACLAEDGVAVCETADAVGDVGGRTRGGTGSTLSYCDEHEGDYQGKWEGTSHHLKTMIIITGP